MAVITNVSYLIIQVLLLPRHWVDSVVLAVGVVVGSFVSCALQDAVSDKMHIYVKSDYSYFSSFIQYTHYSARVRWKIKYNVCVSTLRPVEMCN